MTPRVFITICTMAVIVRSLGLVEAPGRLEETTCGGPACPLEERHLQILCQWGVDFSIILISLDLPFGKSGRHTQVLSVMRIIS